MKFINYQPILLIIVLFQVVYSTEKLKIDILADISNTTNFDTIKALVEEYIKPNVKMLNLNKLNRDFDDILSTYENSLYNKLFIENPEIFYFNQSQLDSILKKDMTFSRLRINIDDLINSFSMLPSIKNEESFKVVNETSKKYKVSNKSLGYFDIINQKVLFTKLNSNQIRYLYRIDKESKKLDSIKVENDKIIKGVFGEKIICQDGENILSLFDYNNSIGLSSIDPQLLKILDPFVVYNGNLFFNKFFIFSGLDIYTHYSIGNFDLNKGEFFDFTTEELLIGLSLDSYHNEFFKGNGIYKVDEENHYHFQYIGINNVNIFENYPNSNLTSENHDLSWYYNLEPVVNSDASWIADIESLVNKNGYKNLIDMIMSNKQKTQSWVKQKFPLHLYKISKLSIDTQNELKNQLFNELSKMPKSNVNLDLFAIELNKETWSKPISLGINTQYSEISPFMTLDGYTLYFSTNAFIDFGGYDIYKSTRIEINDWSNWSKPIPLIPLNSAEDDLSFFISSQYNISGITKYSSELKNNSLQLINLQQERFNQKILYPESPATGTFVEGNIVNNFGEPINNMNVIFENNNGEKLFSTISNINGEFNFPVNRYLNDGYIRPQCDNCWEIEVPISRADSNKTLMTVYDSTLTTGLEQEEICLSQYIYFDFNSFELSANNYLRMDRVGEFLKRNSEKINKIIITGYTDTAGPRNKNLILPKKRAQSTIDYLSKFNLNITFIAEGAGEEKKIMKNGLEDRNLRSRIEFCLN